MTWAHSDFGTQDTGQGKVMFKWSKEVNALNNNTRMNNPLVKSAPSESVGVRIVASKPEVYMTAKAPNAPVTTGFDRCCYLVDIIYHLPTNFQIKVT